MSVPFHLVRVHCHLCLCVSVPRSVIHMHLLLLFKNLSTKIYTSGGLKRNVKNAHIVSDVVFRPRCSTTYVDVACCY